jgi:L-threonylcarbamoyladenylate synthase
MARVIPDDPSGRAIAIDVLRRGGIVAIPTDTVYGIAIAMDTPGGIERLFDVKQRPPDKRIVLLLDDVAQAARLGVMGAAAAALGAACWPGGLTVVVPRRADVRLPDVLSAGTPTIGLRVPDHDAPRALARALGPLPVTSANLSGRPEARDAAEIDALLGLSIELILDGGSAHGGPASTVIDCSGDRPRVVREGAVPLTRLVEILDAAGVAHDLGSG